MKVKITESDLKRLIRESVSEVLNEEGSQPQNNATQKVHLRDLLSKLSYKAATAQEAAIIKHFATYTGTPQGWVNTLNNYAKQYAAYPETVKAARNLANQVRNMIPATNKEIADAAQTNLKKGGEMILPADNPATTGSASSPKNFAILASAISATFQNSPNSSWVFDADQTGPVTSGVFNNSVGPFVKYNNPAGKKQTKSLILSAIRRVSLPLHDSRKDADQIIKGLTDWVNRQIGATDIKTLNGWFSAIWQVLNTSRNDTPVVAGFQRLMNYFGIKAADGKPYGVDGVIGPNTSAGLKQVGYKDIFAFKSDVEKVQQAIGAQPVDGKVGPNTLEAMKAHGINSIDTFKTVAQNGSEAAKSISARVSGQGPTAITPNATLPTPQVTSTLSPGGIQGPTISMNEANLRRVVRNSIRKVLNKKR